MRCEPCCGRWSWRRVRLPALVVPVRIQRKQAIREYRLYWNSLVKKFDPLSCSRCRRATFSATFANDTVDLLCPFCAEGTGVRPKPR